MIVKPILDRLSQLLRIAPFVALSLVCAPGASAIELGPNDARVSTMGTDGVTLFEAERSDVAFNATNGLYLVVWEGDDNRDGLLDGEREIFGQLLAIDGSPFAADDFRISSQGGTGVTTVDATHPAVTWNATANEFLVVWTGDRVAGETEIYAQRIDGATGALVGGSVQVSRVGPDGDPNLDAEAPAVVWNPADNEYLVVWQSDHGANTKDRIFIQRLNTAGEEIGADDTAISEIGPPMDPAFDAQQPAVTWNAADNEYLVVWRADAVDGEFEIHGQRLDRLGAQVGANDFRISNMGPDGDDRYEARHPAVAHDASSNHYLVLWEGDDDSAGLVDDEIEVFAQRLTGAGAQVGADDFRISFTGPDGNPAFGAERPDVVWNPVANEYFVAWGGDNIGLEQDEIFAQRLDALANGIGGAMRLSDAGPEGSREFAALEPSLAHDPVNNEYIVAWHGDDDTAELDDDEIEIFTQLWGAALPADGDGDGVRDALDICPGFDDALDADLDGSPDGCDACPLVDDELDLDGDGVTPCAGDCDDSRADVLPAGAEIVCDGIDQNCNGAIDDAPDLDGDGVSQCGGDCDDADATNFPGNSETCDSRDNDCDGLADNGLEFNDYFLDNDGDGYGSAPAASCSDLLSRDALRPDGVYGIDPDGYGGAAVLNAYCDMTADEGGWTLVFHHSAADGFFIDVDTAREHSVQDPLSPRYSLLSRLEDFRSDDGNLELRLDWPGDPVWTGRNIWRQSSHPLDDIPVQGYVPIRIDYQLQGWNGLGFGNGTDSLLDGTAADGTFYYAVGTTTDWFGGIPGPDWPPATAVALWVRSTSGPHGVSLCGPPPAGFVGDASDCDDDDATRHPGADEVCDNLDSDCDGIVPADETDDDGDGAAECDGDCDDSDPGRFPGSPEICDGIDNDCDGIVPADEIDTDGDGYAICENDCDDTNADRFPGNMETCDGIDNDCDGTLPADEIDGDGDGLSLCQNDCDDANAERYPGNAEVCDGIDNDCDGIATDEVDGDGDGRAACDGDCDDADANRFPGNAETCDGIDNDCDGIVPANETDADADGLRLCDDDCDDADANRFPGNTEICDGVDNDCDGTIPANETDGDGDGLRLCDSDCDDADPNRYPGNPEACDGIDNDCDGTIPTVEIDADGDGTTECEGDCDDTDANRFAGNPEICDGIDNDCDGVLPSDEADDDADGLRVCEGDCNDDNPAARSGSVELCDGIDNDCDGTVDEGYDADEDGIGDCIDNCPQRSNTAQLDYDADGYGDTCESGALLADFDHSGRVDGFDLSHLARTFGKTCDDTGFERDTDLDRDCAVDGTDLATFSTHFGLTVE
ncbi:MAG: hypothetical protein GY716_02675 [bacterium]|nr:hypothetical protein [bacterium]